jgi:hypothetical protein
MRRTFTRTNHYMIYVENENTIYIIKIQINGENIKRVHGEHYRQTNNYYSINIIDMKTNIINFSYYHKNNSRYDSNVAIHSLKYMSVITLLLYMYLILTSKSELFVSSFS